MSLPYFPMYPADFEADTSHLTLEEDGAYNRLLRLCWMTPGCSLPDDPAWLARRLRVDAATYDRVVAPLLAEFFQKAGGRVFSPRLKREHEVSGEKHKRRVEAGKKGGRPSKALDTNNQDESNALALPKQPEPEPENTLEAKASTAPDLATVGSDPSTNDPAAVAWAAGKRLLAASGIDPKRAGPMLGRWRKTYGDAALIAALGRAQREGAIDPAAFIEGALRFAARGGGKGGAPAIGECRVLPDGTEQEWGGAVDGWLTVRR